MGMAQIIEILPHEWQGLMYPIQINSLRPSDICISKLIIVRSDNDLSPGQYQAIIWTSNGILLIRLLATNSVKPQ